VLFKHFYFVAFLSIWLQLTTSPIYLLPLTIVQCFLVFVTACRVILPYIFSELKS
jgi:squalene monooxygenase